MIEARNNFSKIVYLDDEGQKKILEIFQLSTKYETEPPRGDGIYSLSFKDRELPFWIYGRNIIILDETKLMVEAVKPNCFSPIESIILDLKNACYAPLGSWYTGLSFSEGKIAFFNEVIKMKKQVLDDFCALCWIQL